MTRREPTSEQDQPPPFQQEPEDFRNGPLLVVAALTLALFAGGMLWATWIWVTRSRDMAPDGSAPARELGRRQIGIVDQVPYEQMDEAAALREGKLRRLKTYGWIDRKSGVVHVPIERGYDLAIAEQKGGKP